MITPKEALERAKPLIDIMASNSAAGSFAAKHAVDEALASLQGEDAVERVARAVDPDAFSTNYMSRDEDWHPDDDKFKQMRARDKARAILATESELSTLRARVREVVGQMIALTEDFKVYGPAVVAARQLMEDLK